MRGYAAAKVIEPLYKLTCDRVKQSRVLHTDDTTVPIQHQGHCRQGRLWTYVGDGNHPYVVYDYTPTRSASGYCLNQWPALIVYATNARLSIDNNVSERALRRVAVGRKNWLFAGHDESAKGQAMLWSLIASAQRHELDPHLYLRSVLARLPTTGPDELPNYLPDTWKRDWMNEQAAALARQASPPQAHHAKLIRTDGS